MSPIVINHKQAAVYCRQLAEDLKSALPASREVALALTKLDEAALWLGAAAMAKEIQDQLAKEPA